MPINGQQLGSQYRLETLIGRGGMGEVWRGRDLGGNPVAVKVLLPQFAQDTGIVQRFIAERAILTSVSHPNIVGVRDLVVEGSTLAIVMDLVQGGDLRHHLKERGTLEPSEVCRIGAQIASGLAAIHARHIVHRDVKPENVLLDQSVSPPRVKLTDFGVAKLIEEGPEQYRGTMLAGTPMYMAPEVVSGAIPTPYADLYSLGIVLYELSCGVVPFAGLAPGPMMHAHVTVIPGRPPAIDERLWAVIESLLRKTPSERPPDAQAVATYLEQLSGSLYGQPRLPRLQTPPPRFPVAGSITPMASDPAMDATLGYAPVPSSPAPWPASGSYPGAGWATPAHPPVVATVVTPSAATAGQQAGPPPQFFGLPPGHVGTAHPSPPPKNRAALIAGIIIGVAVLAGGLVGFVSLNKLGVGIWPGATKRPSAVEHITPASSTTQAAPQPSVVTVTATAPAPTRATTTRPTSPRTSTVPLVWPPAGAKECSPAIAVNEVTSCPFAANVADAYRQHGVGTVRAYSPVTELWYDMSCTTGADRVVKCTGGNNAAVYIRPE